MQATLSPQEKARVEIKPTTNADAYVLYLRGRDYQTRPDNLLQDFKSAINLYDQAIKLDPKFALAHARLSATTSLLYHFYEPTETWKQKAHGEALESLRLQPSLGEGHLALGLYDYYTEGDYDAALRELRLAGEALPNDVDVGLYTAAVERRRGSWTQALAAYQHAEQLDPRNSIALYDSSQTYFGLRNFITASCQRWYTGDPGCASALRTPTVCTEWWRLNCQRRSSQVTKRPSPGWNGPTW